MYSFIIHYYLVVRLRFFFFFKQKTAYEMRISDWSSDVCSSDLIAFVTLDPGVIAVLGIDERAEAAVAAVIHDDIMFNRGPARPQAIDDRLERPIVEQYAILGMVVRKSVV